MRTLVRLILVLTSLLVVDARAQVGSVHAVSGNAFTQSAGGQRVEAKAGVAFGAGSTFETSAGDSIDLVLANGQHATLGPDSGVRVDRNANGGLAIMVLSGSLNYFADPAASGPPQPVQLVMGTSVVNVPGGIAVELAMALDGGTSQTGALVVLRGEASVTTPNGTIPRVTSDQAVRLDPQVPPRIVPPSALPAALQARLNAVHAAAIQLAVASLPPSAAGQLVQNLPPPPPASGSATPGGGGGCVGSGC